MPYKDVETSRQKARGYSLAHYYRKKSTKPAGTCSNGTCTRPADDPRFKKCTQCRVYMQQYKQQYRRPKAAGVCAGTDCNNVTDGIHKQCARCRTRVSKYARTDSFRAKASVKRLALKLVAFQRYGEVCACCGEAHQELLSIDHIDGYKTGPRKGADLYSWLKSHNYPPGFRTLCMTCNFTLGHHGYCPHSTLTQVNRTGRKRIHPLDERALLRRDSHRAYYQNLKLAALNAYGGPRCTCCNETHLECLSLDHINQDGAAHRREDRKAQNLYIWLRQRGYPPGFRVLCLNCNFALGHFGYCPHTGTMVKETGT